MRLILCLLVLSCLTGCQKRADAPAQTVSDKTEALYDQSAIAAAAAIVDRKDAKRATTPAAKQQLEHAQEVDAATAAAKAKEARANEDVDGRAALLNRAITVSLPIGLFLALAYAVPLLRTFALCGAAACAATSLWLLVLRASLQHMAWFAVTAGVVGLVVFLRHHVNVQHLQTQLVKTTRVDAAAMSGKAQSLWAKVLAWHVWHFGADAIATPLPPVASPKP